ncbi:MAG: PAS domain S-box protein [Candidatus Lokiarchaeota archaeon]|nr:PAS domain S-box protein [Candidatus Lokiarchaeota archaeon]
MKGIEEIGKEYLIIIFILFITFLTQYYNFLLFHSIAELFSIIIAGGIFVIGWNSKKYMDSSFFLIIGVSFLFIGILDLLHTLSYKGMGIFIEYGSNLPTQLWISARYLEILSFLLAIWRINKKVHSSYLISGYMIITSILIVLIFTGIFPTCYIEGIGLTMFKITSEYIIVSLLILSFFFIVKLRKEFSKNIYRCLLIFIISTIISEMAFTFYIGVYDFSNLLGHIFKIGAFYFLYKAIIQKGIENPFILLHDKLSNSEKKFRFAFDNAADAILWINEKERNIINCNKAAEHLLGKKRDQIIGTPLSEIHDHPDQENLSQSITDFLERVGNINMDGIVVSNSGEVIPVNINASHVIVDNQRVIQELIRDISVRKKIEELNYKLASIVDTTDDAIIGKELNGTITSWNKGAERLYGYQEEEILGKNIRVTFLPDKENELDYIMDIIKKDASIARYEAMRLRKDGSEIVVSLTISPIKDEKGTIIGASTISRNITEKKKMEEQLAASEEKYRNLFSTAPFGIVLFTLDGTIIDTNLAISDIIGYSSEELIGKNFRNVIVPSESQFLDYSRREELARQNIIPEPREIILNKKDGSDIWISSKLSFVEIGGKKFIQALINDVTRRKQAEKRLEQFVSTVSHELRTPITVLSMSTDYLINSKGEISDEIKNNLLNAISRNTSLLAELIEDLLIISKMDEKKLRLTKKEYNPKKIVDDIIKTMVPVSEEKNLKFLVDIDEDLNLIGDYKRIEQVFRILIDNAIKYSEKNPQIHIKAISNYEGKLNPKKIPGVLFQISDNGMGMREKDLNHLFERFYRSDDVADIPGTGLGLSIAKDLIELHDGKIHVESQFGKGTNISIFFPFLENI